MPVEQANTVGKSLCFSLQDLPKEGLYCLCTSFTTELQSLSAFINAFGFFLTRLKHKQQEVLAMCFNLYIIKKNVCVHVHLSINCIAEI